MVKTKVSRRKVRLAIRYHKGGSWHDVGVLRDVAVKDRHDYDFGDVLRRATLVFTFAGDLDYPDRMMKRYDAWWTLNHRGKFPMFDWRILWPNGRDGMRCTAFIERVTPRRLYLRPYGLMHLKREGKWVVPVVGQ